MKTVLGSKRILTGLAAVALVAGGGVAVAASGSSGSPSFLDRVAEHLGISSEKLQDATKAAAIDQVNADLEAGRITKAQADALKKRIESGDFPAFGFPPFGGPGFFERHGDLGPGGMLHPAHHKAAADYLGLTVAQLDARLQKGETLAQIAKAQDKSVDGLKDAILADVKKHLDQAVADGKLTQAQADAMYEHLKGDIDDIVNGRFPRLRHGPPGMRPFGPPDGARMWRPAA